MIFDGYELYYLWVATKDVLQLIDIDVSKP
jgi:hypothetical protein